jgi:hypothetical protein
MCEHAQATAPEVQITLPAPTSSSDHSDATVRRSSVNVAGAGQR